jgi:hypothetical protein
LLFLAILLCANSLSAQQLLPVEEGERKQFSAYIEMPRGYVSGICILLRDGQQIKGSIFNEFGISAIDFSYDEQRDKVKLYEVVKMLNRWYIKRVIRRDLRELIHQMQQGKPEYTDIKHNISFKLSPLNDTITP